MNPAHSGVLIFFVILFKYDSKYNYIGIDIGGSKIIAALVKEWQSFP